jgi:hypothetical protein
MAVKFRKKVGAICLTAEVERDPKKPSGYRIADRQRTVGTKLYARERFEGIAAAARLGFAYNYLVIGGHEDRYPGEGVDRAEAFRDVLVKDFNVPEPKRFHWKSTGPNSVTEDSIRLVRELVRTNFNDFVILTSWYHCLRTADLYKSHGLPLEAFPAEAFLLIEGTLTKAQLARRFGGGDFAERVVGEINYFADKLMGRHKPIRK